MRRDVAKNCEENKRKKKKKKTLMNQWESKNHKGKTWFSDWYHIMSEEFVRESVNNLKRLIYSYLVYCDTWTKYLYKFINSVIRSYI